MPRNSTTGVYEAPTNSFNPAQPNTIIDATDWNATLTDIETALSSVDATTRAQWARMGQVQDGTMLWGGTAGGTADARTITLTPAITAYATGQTFAFINGAAANTTTTPTLNVNSVGTRTIVRSDGSAVTAGDLPASTLIGVFYDGTNFRIVGTARSQRYPSLSGNALRLLRVNSGATDVEWVAPGASTVVRSARTSNTILGIGDLGSWVDITSGTFTQTFSAAATLGSGWWCYLGNSGTGDITLDPNGSETIDGLTSYIMYPGEVRLVQCDGSALRTIVIASYARTYTSSASYTKPPGYRYHTLDQEAPGGGGGSGSKSNSVSWRAGAGGGGGRLTVDILDSEMPSSATVIVGAAGLGGAAVTASDTAGNTGTAGGNSSFDGRWTVSGGSPGQGAPLGAEGDGGRGGFPAASPQLITEGTGSRVAGGGYASGSAGSTRPGLENTGGGGAGGGDSGGGSPNAGCGGGGQGTLGGINSQANGGGPARPTAAGPRGGGAGGEDSTGNRNAVAGGFPSGGGGAGAKAPNSETSGTGGDGGAGRTIISGVI